MSAIYLPAACRIRNYGATVKGELATVKIEITVSDPGALGFLLEDLARTKKQLAEEDAPRRRPAKTRQAGAGRLQIERAQPLLGLPYYGSDEP